MATVLITGAGGGLGFALATVFGAAGHKLILQYRHREPPIDFLHKQKVEFSCIPGDIRMFGTIDEIMKWSKEYGVSIFINNAARYMNKSLLDCTDCDIKEMIDTNITFPLILTRKILQLFDERKEGIIININSLAGKSGSKGESLYSATKHAMSGVCQSLQYEGVQSNIRVFDLFVGAMKTDMATGRKDFDKLIDPIEVATFAELITANVQSFRIPEVTITRRNY